MKTGFFKLEAIYMALGIFIVNEDALGAAERAAVAARPVLMVVAFSRCHYFPRLDNTSSISPYSLASRAESQ